MVAKLYNCQEKVDKRRGDRSSLRLEEKKDVGVVSASRLTVLLDPRSARWGTPSASLGKNLAICKSP